MTAGALVLDLEVMGRTNNIGETSTCLGTLGKELDKLEPLLIELSGDKSLATDADQENGASQALTLFSAA